MISGKRPNRLRDPVGRDQSWIEASVLVSSPFEWDTLTDCALLRGELGNIFKSTHSAWVSRKISEALRLFLFVLGREEAQAMFLHIQGRSDHDIGRTLKCDPKTAKVRWMAAEQKLAANSPSGERESVGQNEKSRQ